MRATRPLKRKIALVFDYDKTLARSTFDVLFEHIGMDREDWEERYVSPRHGDGWDDIIGRAQALLIAARDLGNPITHGFVREVGADFAPYDGVTEMPDRLRAAAADISEEAALDFTILSSGYADLIKATPAAAAFDRVWGSAFHFNEDGEAEVIKRTITHPEKARYLMALSKGLDIEGANGPNHVQQEVAQEDKAVPMDQMIYVGDGASDLPAFALLEQAGGIAIAVRHGESLDASGEMEARQRPQDVENPSYEEDGRLMRALSLAVRSHAARVALKGMSG